MSDDILDQIQATIDGTCGGCGSPIPPTSVSAYYCKDECQRTFLQSRASEPEQVLHRNDRTYAYPVGPMRWRPDMVTPRPTGSCCGRR